MRLSNIFSVIYPYRYLLVAFSGGLDSTVLLHQLVTLREKISDIKIRAIHIHHNLSINADKWVLHCKSLCIKWNVPLLIEYVTLMSNKLGIEGQAREARYTVFKKALIFNEVLVTAHHLDDQSETFLLALKRGSGPTGLSSMTFQTAFANTKLLRPFLKTGETRASLLQWAQIHNLCWIDDESNQNDSYDRNFLRLRILPSITKRWPYFSRSVARSASLCAEQETLLDELLENKLATVIADNGTLIINPLIFMSVQCRFALLRRWLFTKKISMLPSRSTLSRIWNEVALARRDASPCLCVNSYTIRRFRGHLWCVTHYPSLRGRIINWFNISDILTLPHNLGYVTFIKPGNIRLPMFNEVVSIRFEAIGMLHIVGRNGGRKLKKIWQEYSVPPWLRNVTPLLFYDEKIIAAAGLFITNDGWAENGVQLVWKR